MARPNWSKRIVSEDGVEKIAQSITKAESHTSAEIVPMIVSKSILTGHVPWLLFLILLIVGWVSVPETLNPYWHAAAVVVAAGLSYPLRNVAWIARWLTPAKDEALSVHHRAQLEFYLSDIRQTSGATGVLIFVSLLERKAIVLADTAVAAKYDEHAWDAVLKALTGELKHGNFAQGMCKAVEMLGQLLQEKFPAATHETNQLPNALIIKD